jgi:Zn-dependent protease with chaperone function
VRPRARRASYPLQYAPPVKLGGRSQGLLFALGLVAGGNGLLLGISLYGLLAAVLHVLSDHAPGIGWAVAAGGGGAIVLLVRSYLRVDTTGDLRYGESLLDYEVKGHARLVDRLGQLARKSSLAKAPALRVVDGALPNAYTVSRSREEAAIVVTRGLLRDLSPSEQDAVVAHELAQIESDEVITAAFADAIAVSIEELGRIKGRFFWSPKEILLGILPFIGAMIALAVIEDFLPEGKNPNALVVIFFVFLLLGALRVLYRAAILSWRGLAQLALFAIFLGPTTLIEWVLEPPTAFLLSRLVSRERVLAADRRAVELTREPGAAVAALRRLGGVEYTLGEPSWAELRFSLFVVPRAHGWFWGRRERLFASHPPITARIERLQR